MEYPENTLLSFRKAFELGVDVIETDLHFTKDKKFIVIHDPVLDKLSDGKGKVSDYTLEELKNYDAGYSFTLDNGKTYPYRGTGLKFLSLGELLAEFQQQRFNVELKDKAPRQVRYYLDTIKEFDACDRVLTASRYYSNLRELRRHMPEMATSMSFLEIAGFYLLYKTGFLFLKKNFKGDVLQIPEFYGRSNYTTLSIVRKAHNKKVRVHIWTVNEEKDMRRLLEAGVDGIFTDNSKLLKKILPEYSD